VHLPVLQKEVIRYLDPKPGENFIDCTIGEGGHARAILKRILPNGKLLGVDRTPELIERLELRIKNKELSDRLILVCDNFVNLEKIVEKYKFGPVHGILFDLGISSWHLEESGRGFSFLRDEPLVMRFGSSLAENSKFQIPNSKQIQNSNYQNSKHVLTAEEIINTWTENDIAKILKEYGEERFARKIATEIVKARKLKPIKTTFQLVEIIKKATPRWYHRRKLHPATKTFQALRIAVNDEVNSLKIALPAAFNVLTFQGRLAVISFHSLEDRIVKNFFREKAKEKKAVLLTKKPITPESSEIVQNPKARSAKLRVLKKISAHKFIS